MSSKFPKAWTTAPLSSLCQRLRGVSYGREEASPVPKNGYFPIVRANNLQNDRIVLDALVWIPHNRIYPHQKLPTIHEQQEIVRRVEALFKIADRIEERYQKAKAQVDKLTQSILAKAFRGDLVPQDPNDEPASALLEKIANEKAGLLSQKKRMPAGKRAAHR